MALQVGEFLPDIAAPAAAGTTVLLVLHSAECPGCRAYLQELATASDEFQCWDARLLVALPSPPASPLPFGRLLLSEPTRFAPPRSAAVFIADRYGQIFYATYAGVSHEFPALRELTEWLKFLGTLCPE